MAVAHPVVLEIFSLSRWNFWDILYMCVQSECEQDFMDLRRSARDRIPTRKFESAHE